jgi:hypothetical protein
MAVASLVSVPPNTPQAVAFTHQGELIWIGLHLFAVAVAAVFLLTGLGVRLRTALDRVTSGRGYPALVLFAWAYLVADAGIALPLRWIDAARWARWASFGVKAPELAGWLAGQAVGLVILCAASAVLLWVPYGLMARRPRTWWLWLTAIAAPALAAGLVLWQTILLPMATRSEPLGDPALTARIEAMAARCWWAGTTRRWWGWGRPAAS